MDILEEIATALKHPAAGDVRFDELLKRCADEIERLRELLGRYHRWVTLDVPPEEWQNRD